MKRLVEAAIRILELLAGALFLMLFFLNILKITLRYFLGWAWLWVPDFSRLVFIWMVFLGATVLYARGAHLVIDFFLNRMEEAVKRWMNLLIDAGMTVFLIVLLLRGIDITRVRMRIPFDTWDFPTGYAYAAVPVCSAIMIAVSLSRMADLLRARREQ